MLEAWNQESRHAVHDRWQSQLRENLPVGVPVSEKDPSWPETFAEHECRQCLLCRYYCDLEGPLGMDWGACLKAGGQYDRQVVFEHWTCRDFENAPDAQAPHSEWYRIMAEAHDHMAADWELAGAADEQTGAPNVEGSSQ